MSVIATMTHNYDCPVCLYPISDPRVLPCQHTFCLECLKPIIQGGMVNCPTCRQLHFVKIAESLPMNFALKEVLELSSSMTGAVERPEFLKCHNCAKEMDSKLVKFFSCLKCTAIDSCEPHICCANCVISDHWGHETVVPLGQFYANQQAAILERTRAVFDEKIKEKFAVVEELTVVLNSLKSSVPVIVQTYNQIVEETQQLRKSVEKAERLNRELQQSKIDDKSNLSHLLNLQKEAIKTAEIVRNECPYVVGPLFQLSKMFGQLSEETNRLQDRYGEL